MSDLLRSRPTVAPIAAFLCLALLLVEAHEQAHALSTRLLCGGWAERTFDNVLPYPACGASRLAFVDAAGPLFSYACLWLGAALTGRANPRTQAFGFALLFAGLPLGRVLPQVVTIFAAGSTSDEYAFVRRLAGDALGRGATGGVALALALALSVPPLLVAWRRSPSQGRLRTFAGFCLLPLLFVIAWLMVGMNGLLARGVLGSLDLAGWPGLVAVHTAAVGALFALLRTHLAGREPAAA